MVVMWRRADPRVHKGARAPALALLFRMPSAPMHVFGRLAEHFWGGLLKFPVKFSVSFCVMQHSVPLSILLRMQSPSGLGQEGRIRHKRQYMPHTVGANLWASRVQELSLFGERAAAPCGSGFEGSGGGGQSFA